MSLWAGSGTGSTGKSRNSKSLWDHSSNMAFGWRGIDISNGRSLTEILVRCIVYLPRSLFPFWMTLMGASHRLELVSKPVIEGSPQIACLQKYASWWTCVNCNFSWTNDTCDLISHVVTIETARSLQTHPSMGHSLLLSRTSSPVNKATYLISSLFFQW